MKMNKVVIFVLTILVVLTSCKVKENTQNNVSTVEKKIGNSITFFRGACYGQCPVFKITILKDGSFKYNGKSYVENIGEYVGFLTTEQTNNLFQRLERLPWETYPEEYPIDNVDFPSFSFEFKSTNVSKKVRGNSNAPKELQDLTFVLDALVNTLEMSKL